MVSLTMVCGFKMCSKQALKMSREIVHTTKRLSNTVAKQVVDRHRHSLLAGTVTDTLQCERPAGSLRDYRFIYPEFLPNPETIKRDRISEKLERRDMLNRRAVISLPEFYVGSVLAVYVADCHASNKQNRFVGICIQRAGHGLRASFILRNVVDGQGVEITYDLYSPLLQKIEVLKLEKRLDDELFYLRDAPAEYSTFPSNFAPVALPSNETVPINCMKVKLGPRPWSERWERRNLKGIADLTLPQKFYNQARHPQVAQPWQKHDLMLKYRETIHQAETEGIMYEVCDQMKKAENNHKMLMRKRR